MNKKKDDLEAIREIEKIIDNYQLTNEIFEKNRSQLIECMSRIINKYLRDLLTGEDITYARCAVEHIIDSFDITLKWIYKYSCDNNNYIYEQDLKKIIELFDNAANYKHVEHNYILMSDNKYSPIEAELYLNKDGVYFYPKNRLINRKKAYNSIFINQRLYINDILNDEILREMSTKYFDSLYRLKILRPCSGINKEKILYIMEAGDEIWYSIFNYYTKVESYHDELDDDWSFEDFTVGEVKEIFCVFKTIATIYSCIREDDLLKIRYEELESIILKRSTLNNKEKIRTIINLITYKSSNINKKIGIEHTPVIELKNELVIIPYLIECLKAERNFVIGLNKRERYKAIYDSFSGKKEKKMIDLFREKIQKYDNIIFSSNKNIYVKKDKKAEIDIAIFDKNSHTLLILECKWSFTIGSERESLNRCEVIEKGINQIRTINQYAYSDLDKLSELCYGKTSLEIKKYYGCVLTKNEIGTYILDEDVKVISETGLYDLIEKYNGNLKNVIKDIDEEKFLPVKNLHYKEREFQVEYGGYKFRSVFVVDINNKKSY